MRLTLARQFICATAAASAALGSAHAQVLEPHPPNPRYLERTNPRDWTLTIDLKLRAPDNSRHRAPREQLEIDTWRFQNATVIFPMIEFTSSSVLNAPSYGGDLRIGGVHVSRKADELTNFPLGVKYGAWIVTSPDGQEVVTREVDLSITIPVRAHRTVFHEDAAMEVDWPRGDWPQLARSSFEPMPFVDHHPGEGPYDMSIIRSTLQEWTQGQDPRNVRPAMLAKFLAGQVVELIQPVGDGLAFDRTGLFEGIPLDDPNMVVQRRRGTPFEMATVLAAFYREAGLPARVVIGYDAGDRRSRRNPLLRSGSSGEIRSWVEFCLYDERDDSLTWVPVDVYSIRKSQSRMARGYLDRPLKHFGTHDELDGVVPFAMHFFPPTTVRSHGMSGSPAFWGWFVTPTPPERAHQFLTFRAATTPVRGQDRDAHPR